MLLSALLLAAQTASAQATLRTVDVAVHTEDGAPVEGLVREEVVVLENGVARDVSRIEPDERPLVLALLVDTSEVVGSDFRLRLLDAVVDFLERLPAGTRYTLWTTGARDTKLVGPSSDPAAARRALQRVILQGGNTVLDTLVIASRELKAEEGERSAVVVVSSMGPELSNRDRRQVVDQAGPAADEFAVVQYQEGGGDLRAQTDYGYVFDGLTKRTGGLFETTISVMGVDAALRRIAVDLASRCRVSYATLTGLERREVEVQIARPGVEARVIPRAPAEEEP